MHPPEGRQDTALRLRDSITNRHLPALLPVLVGAALIGAAPVLLPLALTLALATAALFVLGMSAVWMLLRAEARAPIAVVARDQQSDRARATGDPLSIRTGRLLFFAGMATVSQSSWRLAVGLTVSELLFIAAFGCCCVSVLLGRRIAVVPATLVTGVAVFAIGGAMSSFSSAAPSQAAVEVVHAIYVMLLWAWTAMMVLRTRGQVITALLLWGFSAALNAVGSLAQVGGVGSIAGPLEGHRTTGFTDHPNDLGGASAVALIPMLTLATLKGAMGVFRRTLRWLTVVLIATALILSGSVAAMAAAALAGILWLVSPSVSGRARVAIVAALAATLLVVSAFGSSGTSPTQRLAQVVAAPGSNPDAGSARIRLTVIGAVWPRIRSDPFVGTGLGNSNLAVSVIAGGANQIEQVHGAPLAAWYETGLFGLVGIMVVFGSLMLMGWRATLAADTRADQLIGWGLIGAFAAFIVYALSAPLYFQQYGWLTGVLIAAWSAQVAAVRVPSPQAERVSVGRVPRAMQPAG